MQIPFSKMHGLGNDFVVIDALSRPIRLTEEQIRLLADRRLGIGCDQLLLVEPPRVAGADFRFHIYNADGSEAEMCGNGARAFARFVLDRGLSDKEALVLDTDAGPRSTRLEADGGVTVNMGVPRLEPAQIPFEAPARALSYPLEVAGGALEICALSLGNPHAVLRVDSVDAAPVAELGPRIERHPRFPNRVNVGFMEVGSPREVRLRVWERGVGETLACGTGACAAMVGGRLRGWLEERVAVDLPGGRLVISWDGEGEPVWMSGPVVQVFEGAIEL
ncbi:diaminopimelate epimerase [Endothiovibrio diazotrophicus]